MSDLCTRCGNNDARWVTVDGCDLCAQAVAEVLAKGDTLSLIDGETIEVMESGTYLISGLSQYKISK